jgi:hypothetical protein
VSFNPNSKTVPYVSIEGPEPRNAGITRKPPTESRTEAERIAAARQRGVDRSKAVNTDAQFGSLHDAAYWTDYAGPETSHFDASRLIFLLGFLHVGDFANCVPLKRAGNILSFDSYNRRAGAWKLGDQSVSISEVREVVDARIQELGLSKAAIFEYLADSHSLDDDRAFHALLFEEQMNRFREA